MEKLKILNKEAYEETLAFFDNIEVHYDERSAIANANFCYIVSNYCSNKIRTAEILVLYDYITDVLQGKYPKLIFQVPNEDRIIWAKKLITKYNEWNLNEKEIEFFAFCIVYSFFITNMNEDTNEIEKGMYSFTSKKKILSQYEYFKNEKIWKFEVKKYSNFNLDNYGYTIENPIEVTSIGMQYDYLNRLETLDGKKITYSRNGSTSGKDDIYIDVYSIFIKGLFGNRKIATLYLTDTGLEDSNHAPKGFKLN